MGKLLAYSMVSGLIMLAMYLVYKLLIAQESQHRFNRGLLLLIYLVSFFAYPLYNLFSNISNTVIAPNDIIVADAENLSLETIVHPAVQPLWATIFLWIFIVGSSVVAIRTIITWIKIVNVIRSGSKIKKDGVTCVIIENDKIAPFSWMQYIVLTEKDLNNSAIIEHELKHIRSLHWFDLIIAQIACIVNWFNPAAWLLRDELMLVHEYQADMAVISGGHNPQEYQMLLIKKAVGSRFPSLTNSINHSKLKKRITMMYKSKSGAGSKLKALAFVPMVALALGVAGMPAVKAAVATIGNSHVSFDKGSENLSDSKIATTNSQTINGGNQVGTSYELYEDLPELWLEISNNIKFPPSLEKENIEANVIVQFTINAEGYLTDAMVLKSSGNNSFDTEALRAVNSVKKKWTPRKKDDNPISVTYTYPVTFKTKGNVTQSAESASESIMLSHTTTIEKDDSKLHGKSNIRNSKTITINNENNTHSTSVNMDIYLDGQKISEEEMKTLNPETIVQMSIDKQNNTILITSK